MYSLACMQDMKLILGVIIAVMGCIPILGIIAFIIWFNFKKFTEMIYRHFDPLVTSPFQSIAWAAD